jgi:hypothetical protein
MAEEKKPTELAHASWAVAPGFNVPNGNFYGGFDATNQQLGLAPEKLLIPRDYHSVVRMSYDFYQRGGMAATVVNRLSELSITKLRNGQRKTGDEANTYFEAILTRQPSRMMRFIRTMALEYFLSGMVLPKVDWKEMTGEEISPKLKRGKIYMVPVFDLYPPLLVNVVWANWGKREYFLKLPKEDIKLIKNGGSKVKEQQLKYEIYREYFPQYVETIRNGNDRIKIDVDPLLRKEVSFNPYPTPYFFNVLEGLVFKQTLRRMDFAVASRIVNAILLVQEGSDQFPLTKETEANLDELKAQILARAGDTRAMERLFFLFSNHTTKLTWIMPDVTAMLNQEKYQQANEEISEGLGFARILVTGESRNAQAAELSTWAIQPMMEELRDMIEEWITTIYEEAAELNNFRNPPEAAFTPIKLQDFVKTAAVFAQAYREGNVSRTTRDEMIGLDFKTEAELMTDELEDIKKVTEKGEYPEMPYNTQVVPGLGGPGGVPNQKRGGRPIGTSNVPVNNRNNGVKPPNQVQTSIGRQTKSPESKAASAEVWDDQKVIELMDRIATANGITIDLEALGLNTPPENGE